MKFSIAIVLSFLLMLCLAFLSWDELVDAFAAFDAFLLCFALIVAIRWARGSRAKAKEEQLKQPDGKQAVPFVVPGSNAKEAARKQLEREQADLDRFMTQAAVGQYPVFNSIVTGLILLPGEQCCAVAQNVEQIVPKANTSNLDDCRGVSFRIAKGGGYDVSGYKGHAVTTAEDQGSDRGRIYVTDQQLVFAGSARILTVKLEQIEDVRVYSNGVEVYELNNQDPLAFRFNYGSSILAAAIRTMVDQARQAMANQQSRRPPRGAARPI